MGRGEYESSRNITVATYHIYVYRQKQNKIEIMTKSSFVTKILENDRLLVLTPLTIPIVLILYIIINENPSILSASATSNNNTVGIQLVAYIVMSLFGYYLTSKLVPTIKEYTLRKNICGKDLGKRGTATADIPM